MWRRAKLPLILLLLIGAAWAVYHTAQTSEWSSFRSERFWKSLTGLHISQVAWAVLFIYVSYFFRSVRWREFLAGPKVAGLAGIFTATLIGFSAVALLGRPGEVVRPFLISRQQPGSLSSQFGAWTLERIFDGLTLGMLIGIVLVVSPPLTQSSVFGASVVSHLQVAGTVLCAGGILAGIALARLRNFVALMPRLVQSVSRLLPPGSREKFQRGVGEALANFTGGLTAAGDLRQFAVCVGLSILVWIPVILAYRAVMQAFGSPLATLNWGAIVVLMAVTVVGSLAQLPAVGGGPQVASILVLKELFGIPLEIASTAAILLWSVSFLSVLLGGLPLAAREGLSWQRLRSIVQVSIPPSGL